MKALITGAGGFLGTALVRRLTAEGWDCVRPSSREADLRVHDALQPWNMVKFDRIFHLAAWTQAGDFCLTHPGEQWIINQQINTTVLAWWQAYQPQAKLVSIGTSCAYEEGRDLCEENYLRGEPIADLFTYAMTKRMLLIGQQSLARQFGLRYLTVIPSTLYGPDYHIGTKQMHFIFDLAWKILGAKHFGHPVVLWGDGSQRRELVYIDDFVDCLLQLDAKISNEIINIGAGTDHTICEFAGYICDLIGVDPQTITYDTDRYVGAKAKMLNVNRLTRIIPGRKQTSLADGLATTIAWLEPQYLDWQARARPTASEDGFTVPTSTDATG